MNPTGPAERAAIAALRPLEMPRWSEGQSPRWERWVWWATWAFVGLGVLLRVVRYGLNFPLWLDEAFVAADFIHRGYRDLLRPLDFGQICPLLFLWIERTAVKLLGFNEPALRLYPLACGVASVFLFRHAAGRVVRGVPLLLATAIFAVSLPPIRHASEVKPYASDLLVALGLLALALEWLRAPGRARWVWALAAAVPWALLLSHPAVFVAGGISLGLAGTVWKSRRGGVRLPFALFNLALVGTFLVLYFTFTVPQGRGGLTWLRGYWANSFPPRDGLGRLARWLVSTHTGRLFAYPYGGAGGASGLTFVAFAVAAGLLWRRGRREVVVLCLAPFGLTLAAAVLRLYPYGGEARIMQYVAPSICLLAGLGAAALLGAPHGPRARRVGLLTGVVLLAVGGFGSAARNLAHPYTMPYDRDARAFARWFWPERARNAEVACLRLDFGIADRRALNSFAAVYLCNQAIYSTRCRRTGCPRWALVSATHPLRCVLSDEVPPENPEVVAWLAAMRSRYALSRRERVAVTLADFQGRPRHERLDVFEFVPRADRSGPAFAGRGRGGPTRR